MSSALKQLKLALKIEIGFGVFASLSFALIMGTFAMDPPSATELDFYKGAVFGVTLAGVPTLLLPLIALLELQNFHRHRRTRLNLLNASVCVFFVFFPLAFWQFYLIHKIKQPRAD